MFPLLFILKVAFIIYVFFSIIWVLLLRLLGQYFHETKKYKSYLFARWMQGFFIATTLLGVLLWFDVTVLEPNWIQIRKVTIEDERFSSGLQDLKIVQIADLHIEKIGKREKQLIKKVNDLKADVIVTNGDFVNGVEGWDLAIEVLSQLKAKYGVYTILGNTDYYFINEGVAQVDLEKIGVTLLRHSNLRLDFEGGGSFWLVGLSDKYGLLGQYNDRKYIDWAFKGVPRNEAKVLLIHDPEHALIDTIADYDPQLILAGDTHGGQVGISFIRQFSTYANRTPYMAGLFDIKGMPMYVNRGIGMKTLNIRFLCRPEITVLTLKKKGF